MKTVTVKVIPNAKKDLVSLDGNALRVYLRAPAADGRANKALIEALARHFRVRKSAIRIVRGLRSREKTVQLEADI
ncbi:MAG: DUF167 domain-containing protein [Candidatus Aenigmarchaeota archaeon]|nr:DUF167 domain-containing protein [Candidatus Aenigmarchaeota archaeon]